MAKFSIGEIVSYQQGIYVVTSVSGIVHPEHFLGGRSAKQPQEIVFLFPLEEHLEEPNGWINARRIKKLSKTQQNKLKQQFKTELADAEKEFSRD